MTLITFLHIQRDKINIFVKSNTAETRLHCIIRIDIMVIISVLVFSLFHQQYNIENFS